MLVKSFENFGQLLPGDRISKPSLEEKHSFRLITDNNLATEVCQGCGRQEAKGLPS